MVGDVANYGKTYLNYFMNHDYIERDKPYLYEFSVKALERVRLQLAHEGKIEDIWVVFEIPSPVFKLESSLTRIEKSSKCQISYGQGSAELNDCYRVYFVGEPNYNDFLTILLALQQIKEKEESVAIESLKNYAASNNLLNRNYLGGIYYAKPVWSPNSKYVAFGVWQDGQVFYEVYDTSQNKYLRSDPLDQMVATEPIWSPDSQNLIFASLLEVKIFEIETGETKSVDVSKFSKGRNFETLLSFDDLEGKLIFAFDTNLLANYTIYEYDPQSGQCTLRARDVDYIHR